MPWGPIMTFVSGYAIGLSWYISRHLRQHKNNPSRRGLSTVMTIIPILHTSHLAVMFLQVSGYSGCSSIIIRIPRGLGYITLCRISYIGSFS